MKRLAAFAAALALLFAGARLLRPPRTEESSLPALDAGGPRERSSTALPDAGTPWSPPVEKGNLRSLKVADVPAPGRTRTAEEAAEAAAVDAAAREPGAGYASFGGFPGSGAGTSALARVGNVDVGGREGTGEGGGPGEPGEAAAGRGIGAPGGGKAGKAPAKAPPEAGEESSWMAKTGGLIAAAKGLGSLGGSAAATPAERAVLKLMQDPVGRQFLQDQKMDTESRAAIAKARAGGAMSPGAEMSAVASAMAANGLPTDPESVAAQLQRVNATPGPPVSPLQAAEILDSMRAVLPSDEVLLQRVPPADQPRVLHAPPPGSARAAYDAVRDVLKQAKDKWGMAPEFPLAVFGVETAFGKNTGGHLINEVLHRELRANPPTAFRHKLATADLAALIRLQARGDLGPYTAANIRGSHGAAFGLTQFRAETWERTGVSPTGGAKNPFDVKTALYSTAHHLAIHQHNQGMTHALWHYNQDERYGRKVTGDAAAIRQHVTEPQQRP